MNIDLGCTYVILPSPKKEDEKKDFVFDEQK